MRHVVHYIKKYPYLFLLVVTGFIFHLLISFPSGSEYCSQNVCGLFFWGPHGHDAIWHLALDSVSFLSLPFQVPIYSGNTLTGYNFLLDIVIFFLSKIGIPPIITYFKLIPLLWFPLFTWIMLAYVKKIRQSHAYAMVLLFLAYFGGAFSYFFTLWHDHSIWGSSSILSMQAGQTLTNPQFAFSLVVVTSILYITADNHINRRKSMILGMLLFLAFGLKFYGGVVSALLVGCYYLLLLRYEKIRAVLLHSIAPMIGVLAAGFLFYYVPSAPGASAFVFSPFAMVHSMIEDPRLMYMKDTVNARYYLQAHGWSPRLVYIELLTTAIFLVFNLGVRSFGLCYIGLKTVIRRVSYRELSIVVTAIIAGAFTILFIQRGVWWNTIQFFYYALFLLNFSTAALIASVSARSKSLAILLIAIIVVVSVPYDMDLVKDFASYPAPAYISREELKALAFLRELPKGAVFTSVYAKERKNNLHAPLPLYAYDDTSYIPAFSGKPVYYADTVQLSLLNIPYEERLQTAKSLDCSVLQQVKYVYEVRRYPFASFLKKCSVKQTKIYNQSGFAVYSITK